MLSFTNAPCPVPSLRPDELHFWLAELDVANGQLPELNSVLSADERERAARFRFEHDRRHYTAARGILRLLLAHYTGVAARSICFGYNAHGKPELANLHPCRFNVSHSHGWALYGFAIDRDVGVDIERVRPDFAGMEIAQRFFSPSEVEALRTVSETERTKAFFNCWTRKEAFMKAKGLGVFLGLHTFAVTVAPGEDPALLSHDADPRASERWTIFDLQSPERYIGAAAVEGQGLATRYWKWNSSRSQKL